MVNRLKPWSWLMLAAVVSLAACSRRGNTAKDADPIASGWNNYALGEFDRAVTSFETALAGATPGSDEQFKALYGLATTWNLRRPGEDVEKARALFQQIVDANPRHDLAAWSLLALARMKHLVPVGEDPDYDEVRKAYQEVMDRYPDHLAAKEAFLYYQSTRVASLDAKQTREALAALEEFVKNPENKFIGPAYSLIAVSSQTLGLPEKRLWAEEQSLATTEVDPTNPFTEFAWQYWNLATIAEFEVGDFATARKYYNKLIEEYPTDIRIFGARKALERMDEVEAKLRSER